MSDTKILEGMDKQHSTKFKNEKSSLRADAQERCAVFDDSIQ